jgi:hypothetical protein
VAKSVELDSVKVGPGPPKPVVVESMSSEEVEDDSAGKLGPGPPKRVVVESMSSEEVEDDCAGVGSSQSWVIVGTSDVVSVSVKGGKVAWFLVVVSKSQVQDSVTVGIVNVPWKGVVSASVKVVISVTVSVTVITSHEGEGVSVKVKVSMTVWVNVSLLPVEVSTVLSVEVSVNGGPVTPKLGDVWQGGS